MELLVFDQWVLKTDNNRILAYFLLKQQWNIIEWGVNIYEILPFLSTKVTFFRPRTKPAIAVIFAENPNIMSFSRLKRSLQSRMKRSQKRPSTWYRWEKFSSTNNAKNYIKTHVAFLQFRAGKRYVCIGTNPEVSAILVVVSRTEKLIQIIISVRKSP